MPAGFFIPSRFASSLPPAPQRLRPVIPLLRPLKEASSVTEWKYRQETRKAAFVAFHSEGGLLLIHGIDGAEHL
jgi:hypothetical protein